MTTAPRMMDSDEILLLERRCDDGMSCDDDAARLLAHIAAQATELQQLRAAKAADRERVMSTVGQLFRDGLRERGFKNCLGIEGDKIIDAAASRVADALAVPVCPALSESDRVRLGSIQKLLRDQPVCWDMEEALLDRLLSARPIPPLVREIIQREFERVPAGARHDWERERLMECLEVLP